MTGPKLVLAACALALLSGCATFRWRDVTYNSEAAALEAQAADFSKVLAEIAPAKSRVSGNLLLCLPDYQTVYDNLTVGGAVGRAYIAKALGADYRLTYDSLVKRKYFDRVDLRVTQGQRCEAESGYVASVYLAVPEPRVAGWYFTSKAVAKEVLSFDGGEKNQTKRRMHLINSIEALAQLK